MLGVFGWIGHVGGTPELSNCIGGAGNAGGEVGGEKGVRSWGCQNGEDGGEVLGGALKRSFKFAGYVTGG